MQTKQPSGSRRVPLNYTGNPGSQLEKPAKHVLGDKITFVSQADTQEAKSFAAKVTKYQQTQKDKKAKQEDEKNRKINQIAEDYERKRSLLGTNASTTDLEELRDKERAEKVVVLKDYVEWHKVSSGWHIDEFKKQATEFNFKSVSEEVIQVSDKKTKELLYEIHFGDSRFIDQNNKQGINEIYLKKGTKKEYVKDANNTFISRFVTRGCTEDQIKHLLKFSIILPRNQTTIIGKNQLDKFDFKGRNAQDSLSSKELEFVHLRDGSGSDQRFLSVTHANAHKTIHSNHGEVFTSEFTIQIDLSKIDKAGIFNQHTNEALESMVSFARLNEKTGTLRKSAQAELETVRYSAIRNRETLLSHIPMSAITCIKVGKGNWQTLDEYREAHDPAIIEQRRKDREEEQEAALEKKRRQQRAKDQKAQKASQLLETAKEVTKLIGERKDKDLKRKYKLSDDQLTAIKDATKVEEVMESYLDLAKLKPTQVKENLDKIVKCFKECSAELNNDV